MRCLHLGSRDFLPKDQPKAAMLATIRERAAAQYANGRSQDTQGDILRLTCALSACQVLPQPGEARQLVVLEALRRSDGNCSAAARMLGMTPQAVSAMVRKRTTGA